LGRIFRESLVVDLGTDIEHVAAVDAPAGRQFANDPGLSHRHLGVPVNTGRKFGFTGSHGADNEYFAVRLGKIEVIDGVMDAKIGKPKTLHETLCLAHIFNECQNGFPLERLSSLQ